MLRRIVAVLSLGSIFAFVVGLFKILGDVQIGGNDGFILRGWQVMLGSLLLLSGSLGVLAALPGRKDNRRVVWRRLVVPVILIGGAIAIWIGFGRLPPPRATDRLACAGAHQAVTTPDPSAIQAGENQTLSVHDGIEDPRLRILASDMQRTIDDVGAGNAGSDAAARVNGDLDQFDARCRALGLTQ